MVEPLKNLLGDFLHRAQITRQVTTAQMVEMANEAIVGLLPASRAGDARACSIRDGILTVDCVNASAMQLIRQSQQVILNYIKRRVPQASIREIRPRLASQRSEGTVLP